MIIAIRQATEADWPALRSIRLKALVSNPTVFASSHRQEAKLTEADWRNCLKGEDTAVFLIYDDATLIGMTGISVYRNDPSRKTAVLWGSWLDPQARGKGLSDAMYRERISWAKTHPTLERIVVSHRASNLASKSANQKHGFRYTHAERKTWPDGESEDELFYSLDIKPTERRALAET